MKKQFFTIFLLTALCAFGNAGEPVIKIPYYLLEFCAKAGIDPNLITDRQLLNIGIPDAVAKIGYSKVAATSERAIDGLTELRYFKITVIQDGIVVEKHYAMYDEYREVRLYLYKNKDGQFTRASFAQGIRY